MIAELSCFHWLVTTNFATWDWNKISKRPCGILNERIWKLEFQSLYQGLVFRHRDTNWIDMTTQLSSTGLVSAFESFRMKSDNKPKFRQLPEGEQRSDRAMANFQFTSLLSRILCSWMLFGGKVTMDCPVALLFWRWKLPSYLNGTAPAVLPREKTQAYRAFV